MDRETLALMKQIADDAAERAVKHTLLTLGLDYDNPIEVQRNMATLQEMHNLANDPEMQKDLLHLREWRRRMDSIQSKGLVAAIGFVCLGGAAIILYAFKIKIFGAP